MSKKWNDPDARENYSLLITLDNIIFWIIFLYLTYQCAADFLAEKLFEYSAKNLKLVFVIRAICISISSYNAAKILFTGVEMDLCYKPGRDYDDFKFKDKISYFKFLFDWRRSRKNISAKGERKITLIRIAVFTVLWIAITMIMSIQASALYGTKNIFQQVMCIQKIDYDMTNNNISEYNYDLPIINTSENGIHYVTPNGSYVELVLTDHQYELLKNNADSSFRIKYYASSGFVISIEKITAHTENDAAEAASRELKDSFKLSSYAKLNNTTH